jgi:hypothetical protein
MESLGSLISSLADKEVLRGEKHIRDSGGSLEVSNPWASSYAPPYRVYGIF